MLALDRELQIEYIPMPDNLRGKYQYYTQANIARLREAGYPEELHSLEKGVEDYVRKLPAQRRPLPLAWMLLRQYPADERAAFRQTRKR
ncbi:MAG: hypothetical protein OET44_09220 [Gammaproteobacteria bacterium]|nr:hypothetical protein [Gammaproteobacteria bacterium]